MGIRTPCSRQDREMDTETPPYGANLGTADTSAQDLLLVRGWTCPPGGCPDTTTGHQRLQAILQDIQISAAQDPQHPWTCPCVQQDCWTKRTPNALSNPRKPVILRSLAISNKQASKWTAGIPVESHLRVPESCRVFSFIWGTGWDVVWSERSKLCDVFTMLLQKLVVIRKKSRWKKCQTSVGFMFKSNFTSMTEKHE